MFFWNDGESFLNDFWDGDSDAIFKGLGGGGSFWEWERKFFCNYPAPGGPVLFLIDLNFKKSNQIKFFDVYLLLSN